VSGHQQKIEIKAKSLKTTGTWNGTTDFFKNYIHHIESYDHTNWCWAELECKATVEGFGTANLSRLVSSPNVKSVSVKCRLQTYCLDRFLACSALHGMPILSTHSRALFKNGTRKYKNETVIPMISVLCYIFTARWMPLCHLSHKLFTVCCVGYNILVKYWFILNPTLDIW